jgi:hypothetical protein
MKILRAITGGILGALAMSLAMFLMRSFGIHLSLEALLGSMIPQNEFVSTQVGGFVLHLLIGAVVALVYAFVFEVAVQRSGALMGGGLGLAHGLLAGLFMSGIQAMNPLDPNVASAPGPFLSHMTLGPLVFLMLHCLYGIVVGVVYGHTVQKVHVYSGRHV